MRAKKALNELAIKQKSEKIYPLFITLFAKRAQELPATMSQEKIVRMMHKAQCSQDEITSFSTFFEKIAAAAFSQFDKEKSDQLFEQARAWLDFFEQKDIS